MIRREWLTILLAAFLVLIVSFAVIAGGSTLATALGDQRGATFLGQLAIANLVLLIVCACCLVSALAAFVIQRHAVDECPPPGKSKQPPPGADDRES